jgi:osmotically inducible lipoprotein OsmB
MKPVFIMKIRLTSIVLGCRVYWRKNNKQEREMRLSVLAILLLILMSVAGCRTYAEQGTAWGALAGGVIGYNAGFKNRGKAALAGALIGGFIGHEIGEDMDREEALRQRYQGGGYYGSEGYYVPDR